MNRLINTFRLFKQTLGWTVSKVRDPHTADLWAWLLIAAQLRLRQRAWFSARSVLG
ncbi:hypothetical protein ABZ330_29320 [Streptomyces sp. NPDC006172]|uniref:hypothetical protein n=1 Tax=Streptomyces sp. NPDC006172 TaxID=3154470 RepID=UPI00340AFE6A